MRFPRRTKAPTGLFRRVWNDCLRQRLGIIVVAAVLMAIDGGSLGLLSWYIKPMIDDVFIGANRDAIVPIAMILFGIFAMRAIAAFTQRSLTAAIGLGVVADLQHRLSTHLMTLDGRFFNRNSPGALLERVRGDTQTLQTVASNALIVIGRDSVAFISLVVVAISIDWRWTLVAFIGLPLLALPVGWLHRLVHRTTLLSRLAAADLSTRLDEIFHGIKAIKINRMEVHEISRADEKIAEYRKRSLQAEQGKAALPSVVDLIAGLGFVAVMIYGGGEIVDGTKTLGDFMAFFAALGLLFDPVRRLAGVGGQLQAASVSLQRVYELLDQRPEIRERVDALPLQNPLGDIHFAQVTFGYEGDHKLFDGLDLRATAGKMTAIVGPSGAGKSTLFNLICRFEDPQAGAVRIGGQSVSDLRLNDLRANISMVTQETALFDESIYQNIACGRQDATEAEVIAAAKLALVTEFSSALPDGLYSACGPRGVNLSGGQRQRIVIARALLRAAPILLLDEATAALDSETENRIQQAIDKALEGRTSIVIAHRLSTVRRAHCIHVLANGRVVESGTHDQLLAMGGTYAAMHSMLEKD